MGVNAQIAVPAFVANQVLTAAQMTQINTGIPVFSTTVTRDAAFSGSGEKVLAQGQYAYIESTSSLMVYSGSAWQTVGGGMTLIESNTFSAVASVSPTTGVFSSTYNFYRVMFHLTAVSGNLTVNLRMRAAGTDYSGTGYTYSGSGYTNADSAFQFGGETSSIVGYFRASTPPLLAYTADIFNPNAATNTNIISAAFTSNSGYTAGSGILNVGTVVATSTQYDSVSFIASSGNFTGRYSVYGYNQ
jgi:hypothetical protein